MEIKKITIERPLNSNSQQLVWSLISTDSGLGRWIADEVQRNGNQLTFRWGEEWRHHDVLTATILNEQKGKCIRWKWDHHKDPDTYTEIAMVPSDLTGDYALVITDFADMEEADDLMDLWEGDFEKLHHTTGL